MLENYGAVSWKYQKEKKKKKDQVQILNPVKMSFKNESEIKHFQLYKS